MYLLENFGIYRIISTEGYRVFMFLLWIWLNLIETQPFLCFWVQANVSLYDSEILIWLWMWRLTWFFCFCNSFMWFLVKIGVAFYLHWVMEFFMSFFLFRFCCEIPLVVCHACVILCVMLIKIIIKNNLNKKFSYVEYKCESLAASKCCLYAYKNRR